MSKLYNYVPTTIIYTRLRDTVYLSHICNGTRVDHFTVWQVYSTLLITISPHAQWHDRLIQIVLKGSPYDATPHE
jgi:hypothetical protein